MYPRRRYPSRNDPGFSDDAFHRGDPNPPMRDRAAWIQNDGFPPIREVSHTTKTDL
jgi:hypothetical protein